MGQILKNSTTEHLLGARRQGLKEIQEDGSVKAHGKVLGMDTFSWVNPEMDGLSRMIGSMSNSLIWVAESKHIEWYVQHYPEWVSKIRCVIVYDKVQQESARWICKLKNVAFAEGVTDALMFIRAVERTEMSFFFTASGEESKSRKEEFELYLDQLR